MYRVLELPDSMKALIYDFGQLSYETEREYIVQMAHNKVELMKFIIIILYCHLALQQGRCFSNCYCRCFSKMSRFFQANESKWCDCPSDFKYH